MNKTRRKKIVELINKLDVMIGDLDVLKSDEESCYDNLPDSIRDSDRGNEMEEYISAMEDALSSLEEAKDRLDEIGG